MCLNAKSIGKFARAARLAVSWMSTGLENRGLFGAFLLGKKSIMPARRHFSVHTERTGRKLESVVG